ncbi:SEL1-like repeat protein [Salidesulfovibrio onnuriiensis]|uniref:SEL1-like repeat protein n=1 Tax=Salidesulfovibrio onnuriiensis TaxID=2583823 RepID=UPI0011C6FE6F|nr:tetratricopeptide repeat protein [Salidesulfovibrio onnuriiensis]
MRVLMNFRVLILVLLLLVVGCKQQVKGDADYIQAHKYFEQGEFEKSFELMLKCAEDGNIEAQFGVGHLYLNGLGVEQNIEHALKWYKSAADRGHLSSMYNIGKIYSSYLNDCKESFYWFVRAADGGDLYAMNSLSIMYKNGECVPKDIDKSKKYYEMVIESESDYARLKEAESLFWGRFGKIDYEKSLLLLDDIYYNFAADAGYIYGVAYSNGYGVEQSKEKAFKHFKLSALAGNASSQYNVGIFLYNGYGVQKDKKEALVWMEKAANKNLPKALTFMGYMYETGEIVGKDLTKAKEYYQKAVKLGDKRAQKRLDDLK